MVRQPFSNFPLKYFLVCSGIIQMCCQPKLHSPKALKLLQEDDSIIVENHKNCQISLAALKVRGWFMEKVRAASYTDLQGISDMYLMFLLAIYLSHLTKDEGTGTKQPMCTCSILQMYYATVMVLKGGKCEGYLFYLLPSCIISSNLLSLQCVWGHRWVYCRAWKRKSVPLAISLQHEA